MECIQGGSLLEKCKAGPIELDEAVNIFGQLCDGLAKAHAAGIIHRDIKPANVLMTEDGIPKLTDFGLAKDDTADTGMTMEGAVIGTLDFMPPEQRQAAELTDHRSDLWSMAATFYQMITGKSPKVINISGLPPKLQSVVAKALEESKDDRFQSAMEMREAILLAHSGKMDTSRSLGEGECPQCATTNPAGNKYCDECGASLQVKCLNCESDIAIWNKACRECGTQQDPLVKDALQALQTKHDEAERLLTELMFGDAMEVAKVIGEQDDPRLLKFATWHEGFSNRLKASRTSEHVRLEELLRAALTHEQAYDYKSGVQTLTQVALSLKQTTVSGIKNTADEITKRLTTKQLRLKELEGIVRERVSKREVTGLLTIVNELLTLKPDRPEVQKLKEQFEKRDADLLEARDVAVKQATQQLSGQQYAEAVATLNTVSQEVSSEQLESLKTKASDLLNQLNDLRDKITTAVNGNHLKNLLPAVEKCLILKADQDDLVKLKQDLIDLEAQMDARNQLMLDKASTSIRNKKLVKLVIAAACVAVVLITGVVIMMNSYAKAIETEIATGNWETVLALDPVNSEGLRMQAAAEKAAAEKAAADKAAAAAVKQAAADKVAGDAAKRNAELEARWDATKKAFMIQSLAPITNTIGMTFNKLRVDRFTMGSRYTEKDHHVDETLHEVLLSKFYMQTTEVTQGQWKAVMETEPWKGKEYVKEGPGYAATYVSWDDAITFCKKLIEKEVWTYRLPTEAEWEYACRAGTQTTWNFGNDEKVLGDYAWFDENASEIDEKYAHQVGLKKPNAFGLYDMHGNVFEWCHDYYGEDYYKSSPEYAPKGPTSGSTRILRGGSWLVEMRSSRSAARQSADADSGVGHVGFRVVREIDE